MNPTPPHTQVYAYTHLITLRAEGRKSTQLTIKLDNPAKWLEVKVTYTYKHTCKVPGSVPLTLIVAPILHPLNSIHFSSRKTLLLLDGMIKLGTLIAPTQRRQAGRQAGRVDNGEISQPSFGLTIKRKGGKKKNV